MSLVLSTCPKPTSIFWWVWARGGLDVTTSATVALPVSSVPPMSCTIAITDRLSTVLMGGRSAIFTSLGMVVGACAMRYSSHVWGGLIVAKVKKWAWCFSCVRHGRHFWLWCWPVNLACRAPCCIDARGQDRFWIAAAIWDTSSVAGKIVGRWRRVPRDVFAIQLFVRFAHVGVFNRAPDIALTANRLGPHLRKR